MAGGFEEPLNFEKCTLKNLEYGKKTEKMTGRMMRLEHGPPFWVWRTCRQSGVKVNFVGFIVKKERFYLYVILL